MEELITTHYKVMELIEDTSVEQVTTEPSEPLPITRPPQVPLDGFPLPILSDAASNTHEQPEHDVSHIINKVQAYDDEQKRLEETLTEPQRARRKHYLENTDPISYFPAYAVNNLPEYAQEILEEISPYIFSEGTTLRRQICIVFDAIYRKGKGGCSYAQIGKLFSISKGGISSHIRKRNKARALQALYPVGRQPKLRKDVLEDLLQHIKKKCSASKWRGLLVSDLVDWLWFKYKVHIYPNTLRKILHSSSNFKVCIAKPLSKDRCEVKLEALKRHYENLQSFLTSNDIPPAFFFNVDEVGFTEKADVRCVSVVVPRNFIGNQVSIPIDRNHKRISVVSCISGDGSGLKPLFITTRKRLERNLELNGYTKDKMLIYYRSKGYVNRVGFERWAERIFIPELKRRREFYKYKGKAVLWLDGCTSHESDKLTKMFKNNNVEVFFEVPGSSDQIQPLDLGIFGILKWEKQKQDTPDFVSGYDEIQIATIYNSWMRVTIPSNIVGAFKAAGIYADPQGKNEDLQMQASIDHAKNVRGMEHTDIEAIKWRRKTQELPSLE